MIKGYVCYTPTPTQHIGETLVMFRIKPCAATHRLTTAIQLLLNNLVTKRLSLELIIQSKRIHLQRNKSPLCTE